MKNVRKISLKSSILCGDSPTPSIMANGVLVVTSDSTKVSSKLNFIILKKFDMQLRQYLDVSKNKI